jgi:hypothetical protein
VQQHKRGWQKSELEAINASAMDIDRIQHMITNIDNNLKALQASPIDARKLRDLKVFFEKELRNRGA